MELWLIRHNRRFAVNYRLRKSLFGIGVASEPTSCSSAKGPSAPLSQCLAPSGGYQGSPESGPLCQSCAQHNEALGKALSR